MLNKGGTDSPSHPVLVMYGKGITLVMGHSHGRVVSHVLHVAEGHVPYYDASTSLIIFWVMQTFLSVSTV